MHVQKVVQLITIDWWL